MAPREMRAPGGETIGWLSAREYLTGAGGDVWAPATPGNLTEALTRRFIRRAATRVAIETSSSCSWGNGKARLLDPATQLEYWDQHIAGHFAGEDKCVPDGQGRTFFSSSWRDQQGRRLILILEVCC